MSSVFKVKSFIEKELSEKKKRRFIFKMNRPSQKEEEEGSILTCFLSYHSGAGIVK